MFDIKDEALQVQVYATRTRYYCTCMINKFKYKLSKKMRSREAVCGKSIGVETIK